MYRNAGKKIKIVSILLFIVGVLIAIYVGVMQHILSDGKISTDSDELIAGSIIIVAGAVASWLVSLIIYGFGLIVESAEKTDEIKDILIDIREKKPDYRTAEEKANNSSASILASSFNNEVFDDREFSAAAPKTPAYVQPAKPSGSADPKFVAPTYAGQGKSRPTVPLFRDDVVNESVSNVSSAARKEENKAVKEPAYEEPKIEEPKYEEPKYEKPKYEEPESEEPESEEPVTGMPKVPSMSNVTVHKFASDSVEEPANVQPVYEETVSQSYAEPAQVYEETAPSSVYNEPVKAENCEETEVQQTYEEHVTEAVPDAPATSPADEARFRQIQDLIYKFVARRNGKVNINDILRTVPRNIEPSEFSAAVKQLEMEGRLDRDDKGEYYAL